jgi:hypothetical protein
MADSAEMQELPRGFGCPYVVSKLTMRNGARIVEKTRAIEHGHQ